MLRTRINQLLLGLTLCIYFAALGAAVYGLISFRTHLNSTRTGQLQVDEVRVETDREGRQHLRLKGDGFTRELWAVVATLPAVVDYPYFLDKDVGRGLWTDGQTVLAAYRKQRLLDIRLQNNGEFTVIGSLDLPGEIDQVVKVGDRALVSLGTDGFCLVDLSVPGHPFLLERYWESPNGFSLVRSMVVSGQRVYAAMPNGYLAMFDMGKKEVPMTLVEVASRPWKATLHGNRLVTGDLQGNLELFELDAQGLPRPVGELAFAQDDVRAVALNQSSLFVAVGNDKLYHFDLRDWPHLEMAPPTLIEGSILSLRLVPDKPLLLVGCASLGLLSLDIAEPENPKVISAFLQTYTPFEMQVVGQKVICAGHRGLIAPDLERVLAGTADGIVSLHGLDYNLLDWGDDIFLLPVSKSQVPTKWPVGTPPEELLLASELENGEVCRLFPGESDGAGVAGDRCKIFPEHRSEFFFRIFCRDESGGLPRHQTSLRLFKPMAGLWRDGFIYTVNQGDGVPRGERSGHLRIYDAANPRSPEPVGQLALPGSLRDLAWLAPHFLVVTAGQNGLHVVDIARPDLPRMVGHLDLPFHLREIAQAESLLRIGDRMYVTHQRGGVSQIDLSDLSRPRIVQILNLPGFAKNMVWQNDLLFISLHRDGVFMVDTRLGQGLAPVGRLQMPIYARELAACPCRLAVAGGADGLFQMPLPRRVDIRYETRSQLTVLLPGDLEPGNYRLYLYDGRKSMEIESAFQVQADSARGAVQNE